MRSTIDLGHNLGLRVVAEGVEDGETLATLADLGCDVCRATTSAARCRPDAAGLALAAGAPAVAPSAPAAPEVIVLIVSLGARSRCCSSPCSAAG